jgi:hypothetical protein
LWNAAAHERLCDDLRQVRLGAAFAESRDAHPCLFLLSAPSVTPDAYEPQIRQQLVAAGATQEAAVAEMKWLGARSGFCMPNRPC